MPSLSKNVSSEERFAIVGKWLSHPKPGDEVVITGISGRFPESKNIDEFRQNLYNKVNMVSHKDRRWGKLPSHIPARYGEIPFIDKLDTGYFGLSNKEANGMDPLCRLPMESAIEAIFDAGVHPVELEGTSTGVIVAVGNSDSQRVYFKDDLGQENHVALGNARCMIANRISYHLKLNGPSYALDSACSSSLSAFEDAYKLIRRGRVEAVVVVGVNLILNPLHTLAFSRLGVVSKYGACKSFVDGANGYVRSESVSAVLLQKAKDARRIYAKILHAATDNAGYHDAGISHPSRLRQKELLQDVYNHSGIDPNLVDLVQPHGTGTKVGDMVEIFPIDEVFCSNRNGPLPLATVKANAGHTEHSAAHAQVVQAVLAMESGLVSPNIHFDKPLQVEPLLKGRIVVPSEVFRFPGVSGQIAISSHGFGGASAHCVIEWNKKTKAIKQRHENEIPRLVCVSGRNRECVDALLDNVKNNCSDAEFIALMHKIFKFNAQSDRYRGYTIVSKDDEICRSSSLSNIKRPAILVSFGECDFVSAAYDLLHLPAFRKIIARMDATLTSEKVQLTDVILKNNKSSSVLITTAVQIALLQILSSLGVEFKYSYAKSSGHIGEACSNRGLDEKQAVLLANFIEKQRKAEEKMLSNGSLESILQNNIDTTLHQQVNVAAVEEESSEFVLLQLGKRISDKTISKFESSAKDIIRFPPQEHENGLLSFFKLIGRLYEIGYNVDLAQLYPTVEFPVSRGTPMISPSIKWNHEDSWYVMTCRAEDQPRRFDQNFGITVKENDWAFLTGHVIDGRNVFPASGYLYLVWETFGNMKKTYYADISVVFEDVQFLRMTHLADDTVVDFTVSILPHSGHFEVTEDDAVVATGKIRMLEDTDVAASDMNTDGLTLPKVKMVECDIYKELRLRGYEYKEIFKGMKTYDQVNNIANIRWSNNWIADLDVMLQVSLVPRKTESLYVLTQFKRLIIDTPKHSKFVSGKGTVPVAYCKANKSVISGGIEIRELSTTVIPKRKDVKDPVLEKFHFVPNEAYLSLEQSINVNLQLILDNCYRLQVKVYELIEGSSKDLLGPHIFKILTDVPFIQPDIRLLTSMKLEIPNVTLENKSLKGISDAFVIAGHCLVTRQEMLNAANRSLAQNGFLISRESLHYQPKHFTNKDLQVVAVHTTPSEKIVLLCRIQPANEEIFIDMSNCSESFEWLSPLQKAVDAGKSVTLYAQRNPINGILGFVNCLRHEPGGEKVKCIYVHDPNAPAFDPKDDFYKDVLAKKQAISIYKNGKWGTYKHLYLERNVLKPIKNSYMNVTLKGPTPKFSWFQGSGHEKSAESVESEVVSVYLAALNEKDLMITSGKLQTPKEQECVLGLEYVGRTTTGQRVMGLCKFGALATTVVADKHLMLPVPDSWVIGEAVTVPAAYAVVLEAFSKTKIRPGHSILIHDGTSDIGQAAIYISLYYKLKIFTTVETQLKREFIIERFPSINERHIGSCNDTSFEQLIRKQTRGRGVDIIINTLLEEKQTASLRCLAKRGTFFEIGTQNLAQNRPLPLELMKKDSVFHAICLDQIIEASTKRKQSLIKIIQDGINRGAVQTLEMNLFNDNEVEMAFKRIADKENIGKVAIKIRQEEDDDMEAIPIPKFLPSIPRYYCNPKLSYVITGGLGGLGLELAEWLIKRGATKLLLSSRVGVRTGYQDNKIRKWRSLGNQVIISTANISSKDGCKALLEEAKSMGPVGSIFHLAVLLADALLENQTKEKFLATLHPKSTPAKYLDQLSRTMCPKLTNFVMFSSYTGGRGVAGKANYGMANVLLERICEERKSANLPALAIQWGTVGDVGIVAEEQSGGEQTAIAGMLHQRISSCIEMMDVFLTGNETIVSSMVVEDKKVTATSDNLIEAVARIIGVRDVKTMSMNSTLPELGMDSIISVEIKQILEKELEIVLSPKDLRCLTFSRLQEIMNEKDSR